MSSVFTKIINREIPGYIVAEDDNHIAFLDINPLVMGHVLVVPKKEVDYIFDLPVEELTAVHSFSQKVSIALKKSVDCKRIGVAIIGLEVPHTHIHLVPLNKMEDINFMKPKLNPSQEELGRMAEKIINNI
ncbi:MAG: histidine triad (HIT) family protein [Marivirga sp.]|jgi:histidine triad (HIT) family protein